MTVGLALLIGAALAAAFGHRLIRLMARSRLRPRLVIALWMIISLSVFVTFGAGVLLLALPGHGGVAEMFHLIADCWSALQHGAPPAWEQFFAAVGGVILVALVARCVVVAVRHGRVQRRRRDRYRFLSALATGDRRPGQIIWLDHPHPIAFAVAGRPGLIAASIGLLDHLPPLAVDATLEHERAHLRGRHHVVLDIVDIAATALPIIPLFAAAPPVLRELVEMAADDVAAGRYGAQPVIDALVMLSGFGSAPQGSLAMATTAVGRRLQRLRANPSPAGPVVRMLSFSFAATLCAALPGLVGVGVLLSLACGAA